VRDRVLGNEYRVTTLCVDSYENNVPVGRMYNLSRKGGIPFQSLTQLLLSMEQLLNDMDCPQADTSPRAFWSESPREVVIPLAETPENGKLATFQIRILFRQHASWQGSILWLGERREERFRSVLELILLLDSALAQERQRRESPSTQVGCGA